jgi:hypothetical protein
MTKHDRRTVAQVVSDYLRDCHPGGVTLEIDEQGIHKVLCQWRVPVRPSVEPMKRYEYYEALSDVEVELHERENLNVFLVPSDPEHSAAAEKQQRDIEVEATSSRGAGVPKRRAKGT